MSPKTRDAGLFYTAIGEGPEAMLVMHGGLGPDHTLLRPWLDGLRRSVRLIYFDHRGGGRSAPLVPGQVVSWGTLAADADSIRAANGVERIVVFGHSLGGMVAMEYALRYQDRLSALVLCCTAAAWDYEDVRRDNARRLGGSRVIATFDRYSSGSVADDEDFKQQWLALQPLYFRHSNPDLVRRWAGTMRFSSSAFLLSEDLLRGFNLVERLPLINVPTLVIAGRYDWVTPVDQSERIAARLPDARLLVFEDSGHYPFVEEHDRFIGAVSQWLRGQDIHAPGPQATSSL